MAQIIVKGLIEVAYFYQVTVDFMSLFKGLCLPLTQCVRNSNTEKVAIMERRPPVLHAKSSCVFDVIGKSCSCICLLKVLVTTIDALRHL